jgi:hypothetical protein
MKKEAAPGWYNRLVINIKKWLGIKVVLCDTCKWNWRSACHSPERPYATWCSDYEKRG